MKKRMDRQSLAPVTPERLLRDAAALYEAAAFLTYQPARVLARQLASEMEQRAVELHGVRAK